jgi:hypothetical protein
MVLSCLNNVFTYDYTIMIICRVKVEK